MNSPPSGDEEPLTPEPTPPDEDVPEIPLTTTATDFANPLPLRLPSLRTVSDPPTPPGMTPSSTPLGTLNAARRPANPPTISSRGTGLSQDVQAKMKAFHLSRQGAPPAQNLRPGVQPSISSQAIPGAQVPSGPIGGMLASGNPKSSGAVGGALVGGPAGFRIPGRPPTLPHNSAPAVPGRMNARMSLAAKRGMGPGMNLQNATGALSPPPAAGGIGGNPVPTINGDRADGNTTGGQPQNAFSKWSEYVDTATGTLKFKGKATIHGGGIDFSSGSSFNISLDEVDNLEELGKGNYGTVYQVRHARPKMRRPGMGLKGNKAPTLLKVPSSASTMSVSDADSENGRDSTTTSPTAKTNDGTTGLIMAMKEIRLELDEAKFAAIIMELDVLHRCISPFIIDFYGAFFQEGAVYICMEFMDGGSVDKLYGDGVPENVLRKIALSTVMGLKALKDEHNIIHRDVKPTNILVNSRGQVKICDFGVSGNLVASIAKTNIGCQSYMAPERIAGGGVAQAGANPGGGTYSVQSDIWSLGLTIIECAMGRYPYPPETYNNIFSQLSAIVDGDPPDLPESGFSDAARDFVKGCLHKVPKMRPTYAMLCNHPWLAPLLKPPTITEEDEGGENETHHMSPFTADEEVAKWVIGAMERRRNGTMGKSAKPALHAVALDAVSPSKDPMADGEAKASIITAGGD